MKRQHPYALIGYTSKNFWLLLIPLVRGGIAAVKFDFNRWAAGTKWDILAVTVMIAAAVIRWYFTVYEIGENAMTVSVGMFLHRRTSIPYRNICAVTTEESPIHRICGVMRAYIDTDAASGGRKSADVSLIIRSSDRARLFNLLSDAFSENAPKKMGYTYKVAKHELIIFSLVFSSALSGVALLITVLSGGTDILGQQLQSRFLNAINDFTDSVQQVSSLISKIPTTGMVISIVIGIGFLISFSVNIMRHLNFTASRKGNCIVISGGFMTKRMYCINSSKINMADLRQNLLMKLFRVTSVHVNCTGYGKRKNEIPVFIPVCPLDRIYSKEGSENRSRAMDMLLPNFSRCESYINPKTKYISRFILIPSLLIFAVQAAALVLILFFPAWHSLILFMMTMAEIPAVWFLFAKVCAYCTNGVNITADSVCVKYCSGYDFHTVTVPRERVAEIRISQSIFQRFNKSCDVTVYTSSEYIGSHKVTGMPISEIQELIRERF